MKGELNCIVHSPKRKDQNRGIKSTKERLMLEIKRIFLFKME